MKRFCFLIIMLCLVQQASLQSQTANQKLYRVFFLEYSAIRNLESTGVNIYHHEPDSYIDILATAEQAHRLNQEGFQIEFLANDFSQLVPDSRLKASPEYHDYQETMDELARIAAEYPDITALSEIGESVLGRTIACLKISDHPQEDEDEVPILICGAHHGNEVLSVEATLFQINYLVENYATNQEVASWVNNYELWFVPLVNPDGREAVRRTNENGIDLNRNYSFQHTAEGNHGTPFSEPETQAIRDLTDLFPPALSLTYHTSGRYVLYPWTHAYEGCPDSTAFIYQGGLLAESLVFPEGSGTGHYTLRQGGRWYFTAGEYCDYMYAMHGAMAYTIEMYTRQNPDGSVIPEVVNRNLEGFKNFMRQASQSGVTGLITDKLTGDPVVAEISIPALDDQGKLEPRLSDSVFGRYYRYLAPGAYQVLIQAEGYRDYFVDVVIDATTMTVLNVEMESGPLLVVDTLTLADGQLAGTSGNEDGLVNLGERLGISLRLANENGIAAEGVYARVLASGPYVSMIQDSIYFGAVDGHQSTDGSGLALFTISPDCPDRETLFFKVEISDQAGTGWIQSVELEVHAPRFVLSWVGVQDEAHNNNGILEPGERCELMLLIVNHGRQAIDGLVFELSADNTDYLIHKQPEYNEALNPDVRVMVFPEVELKANAKPVQIGEFQLDLTTSVGYSAQKEFRLQNFTGVFEDFETNGDKWTHASYQSSSNHHDDWQLGEPQGLVGDPLGAYSGEHCWGTDLGYESYNGETWNGAYQNSVFNYLQSPVIDCSNLKGTGLRLMRCLTTLSNDIGRIRVNDSVVWESPRRGHADNGWVMQEINISSIADGNPAVVITFELETDDYSYVGGWNIDDVIVANGMFASNSSGNPANDPWFKPLVYPNPFVDQCRISFRLAQPEQVNLAVFDAQGRRVKTLADRLFVSGEHELDWNGCNDAGMGVPPGIYSALLVSGEQQQVVRLIKVN